MSKIKVTTLSMDKIGQLGFLLENSRQKPYRFLQNDLQSILDSFWLGEIIELLQKNGGKVFVAMEEAKIAGMIVYSDLPWDSQVIGNKMGALKYIVAKPSSPQSQEILEQLLNETIDWAMSCGVEFLLSKTYTDDILTIHALEKKGFLLVDTLLDYVYDLKRNPLYSVPRPILPQGFTIRLAEENDMEELVMVARDAFKDHFGRFHLDEKIPKNQAAKVYEEWVKSSCQGYADWILIAETAGRIGGYSIWKKPSPFERSKEVRVGHYSIGAVHPDYFGQGLFSALTRAGMEFFDGIADYIEGPTHINNYPVQRGYTKLLWRICDARHSFHKWLLSDK